VVPLWSSRIANTLSHRAGNQASTVDREVDQIGRRAARTRVVMKENMSTDPNATTHSFLTCVPILKWAAGVPIQLPDKIEFDTKALLALVEAHNLVGRLIKRIDANRISWVTPELARGLERLHRQTSSAVSENINAYLGLKRHLSDSVEIVLIKGIATYVICGQAETKRAGDIDLLSNNPAEVIKTLLHMGYIRTRSPFMHEMGEYTKGAVEFDIHDHFPVYRYSEALLDADLWPQHSEAIWYQNYELKLNEIRFGDFETFALRGDRVKVSDILVPDPTLLAIVICAHSFMNYTNLWSISHRPKAYVRLGEIADLATLAAHPFFDHKRFLRYMDHFGAQDAVEWAASVAVSVLGKNPLPIPVSLSFGDPLPAARFPRCLWWNCWASLFSDPDDLLRTQWLSMDWLLGQIGENRVSLRDGRIAACATIQSTTAQTLSRLITLPPQPVQMLLHFEVSDKGLVIALRFLAGSEDNVRRVRVDFGSVASEWIIGPRNSSLALVGYNARSWLTYGDRGLELRMEFSWSKFGLSVSTARTVALLIGAASYSGQQHLTACTLIPLVIECQ
jgi:hypothetical protein